MANSKQRRFLRRILKEAGVGPVTADQQSVGDRANISAKARRAWGAILALASIIGVPAALVSLYPRLTVTISDPADPKDPFSSIVTVTNSGILPLSSIQAFIAFKRLQVEGHEVHLPKDRSYSNKILVQQWSQKTLRMDEAFSFTPDDIFFEGSNPITYTEMAVGIDYEIPVLHLKREKLFQMQTGRTLNGGMHWFVKPPMDRAR